MRSGAEPAALELEVFSGLEAMPEAAKALFAVKTSFQSSLAWYRTVMRAAMPHDVTAQFVLCRRGAQPVILVPMQRPGQLPGDGPLESLTTPYTTLYQPLVAPGVAGDELRLAGRALGRFYRRWGTTRLDALDAAWPGWAPLLTGFRQAGLVAQRFDHFGNWHAQVGGLSWNSYLAVRPGALRETVRRKLRRAERDGRIDFELTVAPEAAAAAISAYENIHRRSWKDAEPFPDFNAALVQAAAELGLLRLGVLRHDGMPAAAQYWVVENGCATVLKLVHDEAFASWSPGTVLTAMMIRHLLDQEAVTELDFGRGDDAYKRLWTDRRRQRIGFMLVNPLRPGGLATLVRHVLGQGRRLVRRTWSAGWWAGWWARHGR